MWLLCWVFGRERRRSELTVISVGFEVQRSWQAIIELITSNGDDFDIGQNSYTTSVFS